MGERKNFNKTEEKWRHATSVRLKKDLFEDCEKIKRCLDFHGPKKKFSKSVIYQEMIGYMVQQFKRREKLKDASEELNQMLGLYDANFDKFERQELREVEADKPASADVVAEDLTTYHMDTLNAMAKKIADAQEAKRRQQLTPA